MTKITFETCPNFQGSRHYNDHELVPEQLRSAHLHPLTKLGAKNKNGDSLEKAPSVKWGAYEGGISSIDSRYGVCLSRSGFFVLDVDVHTVDGNATLTALAKEAGVDALDTFTVSTPTGGFHYYFQLPKVDIQGNGTKKVNLWPGIDTFPKGQQVLGPGTSRTMDDKTIGYYEVVNSAPVATIPDWFLTLLQTRMLEVDGTKSKTPTSIAATKTKSANTAKTTSPRARVVLENVAHQVKDRAADEFKGDRNDFLYRQAFKATRAGATLDEATETLRKIVDGDAALSPHWESMERGLTEGAADANLPADYFSPLAMAGRFAKETKDLLYVRDWRSWYRYRHVTQFTTRAGTWSEASDNEALFVLTTWVKDKYDEAVEAGTDDEIKGYVGVLMKPAIAASLVRYAESLLGCEKNIFNSRKDALVAANGIINLRTGTLHPHSPKAYSTLSTSISYHPDATSPVWEKVKAVLMDDTHDYIRMVLGIATTGYRPSANSYWVMPGKAGNGKSTLFDTIRRALDQYALKLESGALAVEKTNTFGLSQIEYKRFILTEEIGGRFYDAELVKDVTGGATVPVAAKHKDTQDMENHSTLIMAMNYPIASPSKIDEGIRRRAKVVPFDKTVKSKADYDVNNPLHVLRSQEVIDLSLSKESLEACLVWLVSAASAWLALENKADAELTLPSPIQTATTRYLVDEDPFAQIIEDRLVFREGSYITTSDLKLMGSEELEDMGSFIKNQSTIFNKFEETGFFTEHHIERKKNPPSSLSRSVFFDKEGQSFPAGPTVRYYPNVAFRSRGTVTADVDGGLSTEEDDAFANITRGHEADLDATIFEDNDLFEITDDEVTF